MNYKKNVIILFFSFILSMSLLCIFKIYGKTTKKPQSLASNSTINTISNDVKSSGHAEKSKPPKAEIKKNIIAHKKSFNLMRLGCRGENVLSLQKTLLKFGYTINCDGIFGCSTQTAVYDFQKRNNLNRDGIVGVTTFEKLKLEPTEKTKYNPKDNIFSSANSSNYIENFLNTKNCNSNTDYYIWVNTKKPKTYIFKGYNHHWKIVRTCPCTVGRPSTPTIKGTFKVGTKGDSFIVKNNSKLMCKYFTQISGNYLFHSVLLTRNGHIANGILGAKISHGCIRLSLPDSKYIYYSIPKNTTIYIN